jgi:hypothetical protein
VTKVAYRSAFDEFTVEYCEIAFRKLRDAVRPTHQIS